MTWDWEILSDPALPCPGVITSPPLSSFSPGAALVPFSAIAAITSGGSGVGPPASGALVAFSSPGAGPAAGGGLLVLSSPGAGWALAETTSPATPKIVRLKIIFFIGSPFLVVALIVLKHHFPRLPKPAGPEGNFPA